MSTKLTWRRVGLWGLESGMWCIGKILSNGVARYVLSRRGGDSLGWFDSAEDAMKEAA